MRLVMKFGGSSVSDVRSLTLAADIVESHARAGDQLVVVVSAQRTVTDQLIEIVSRLPTAKDDSAISHLIQTLRERHIKTLEGVAPAYIKEISLSIDELLHKIQYLLVEIYTLKEVSPTSRDYIISAGERLLAPIFSAALNQRGLISSFLDGGDAGIVTTLHHGDATALRDSDARIMERIGPLLGQKIPVVMGFMGCTPEGVLTTLGRGGSDYTASLIGAGIDADEIWIWTDVEGIMTSDPKLIKDVRLISVLSYQEAMELSLFGAKVIHPKSLEPAMRKEILMRIKNTFIPTHPGTLVLRHSQGVERLAKAVTYIDRVVALDIHGLSLFGSRGMAGAILTDLADHEVHVMMLSQNPTESKLALIIDKNHLSQAVSSLTSLQNDGLLHEFIVKSDVCALAVVGIGMLTSSCTCSRILTTLSRAGITVLMISHGASDVNISLIVKKEEGLTALRLLHDEFRLSEV